VKETYVCSERDLHTWYVGLFHCIHRSLSLHMSRMWHTCISSTWHIETMRSCDTRVLVARDTYECVVPHVWMSHVTHMNESCHTYEWVMSHVWMSQDTQINESCHTHGRVMSHVWMSHVTHRRGRTRAKKTLDCLLSCSKVCCSVLQCVAVCCSVLQCVAVCCSVYR